MKLPEVMRAEKKPPARVPAAVSAASPNVITSSWQKAALAKRRPRDMALIRMTLGLAITVKLSTE